MRIALRQICAKGARPPRKRRAFNADGAPQTAARACRAFLARERSPRRLRRHVITRRRCASSARLTRSPALRAASHAARQVAAHGTASPFALAGVARALQLPRTARPPAAMRRAAFRPLLAALLAAALVCTSGAAAGAPPLGFSAAHRAHAAARGAASPRNAPLRHPRASDEQLATCTVSWFETDIDHFSWVRRRRAPCCAAADLALTQRSCNVALRRPRSAPSLCATLSAAWSSGGPRRTGSPGPYSSTLATCVEAAARCCAPGLRRAGFAAAASAAAGSAAAGSAMTAGMRRLGRQQRLTRLTRRPRVLACRRLTWSCM